MVRQVYEIDAVVQPGNSGGPLIDAGGQVIGVVFSRSTVDADVGYALTSPGVLPRVPQAAAGPRRSRRGALHRGLTRPGAAARATRSAARKNGAMALPIEDYA